MAVEDYVEHMPLPVPPEDVIPMSKYFLEHCPVVHSDEDGGFWVINRHADVVSVLQDWKGFASGNKGVRVRHDRVDRPPMPPLDSNPPFHRKVREVLNPFLSPQALAKHEGAFREIIAGLIDEFAAEGQCDLATQLAKKFPSQITCQELLKVTDSHELDNLRNWNRRLSYDMFREDPKVLEQIQEEWAAWSYELVSKRRDHPGDDLVSSLIQAQWDGKPLLTDQEIVGAIQILVSGGFSTTADATCNIVVRLIEDPELEPLLRQRPNLIPNAIEEILRLDPPVATRPRRATSDVDIGGKLIRENDRILCNYLAANVDPEEWERPDEFVLGRARNRIMTFSAGPHRCVGSHMARLSLRIVVEELLARLTGIRYQEGKPVIRISPNTLGRTVDSLPITFTPLH